MTVRQPWASLIVHYGKGVENRSRNIVGDYRGPVAIHASLTLVADGDPAWSVALEAGMDTDRYDGDDLHLGHLIGVVDVVGSHVSFPAQQERGDLLASGCCESVWGQTDLVMRPDGKSGRPPVHIELANPCPITPIPCRGALGLWTPEPDVLAQLAAVTT